MFRSHILVCGGTGCTSGNSMKIYDALVERIKKEGLEEEVHVTKTGCFGLCALGPIMIVYPEGAFYSQVKLEDVDEIIDEHIIKGRIVTRLLYKETVGEDGNIKALNDTDFYKKQHRVALRNCGVINPEKIEEYIAYDGYEALGKKSLSYAATGDLPAVLAGFRREFFAAEHAPRCEKHLSSIERGAACKRLCMYLRWMVRRDDRGVDFGLWQRIPMSALRLPLDLHVGRTARALGLLTRRQNDWRAVEELTAALRTFDAEDPARYDFSLFGAGIDGYLKQ